MAIDKTGKWWKGTAPEDIQEYLIAYTEDGYRATEFRLATCTCGSRAFHLEYDEDEGATKRTCVDCGHEHFICDSKEYWEDVSPKKYRCAGKCKSKSANVCVGFALRKDRQDIHWIYVGIRCVQCGLLGCIGEWKISYGPSLHLMDSE